MNAANKRIAKNTLALYFRMILTVLVTLYTSRVVLAALGASDFGIFSLVGGIVLLFGFLNAAMVSTTQRFLNYEKGRTGNDTERVRIVFATSLYTHFLIAGCILLVAETLGLWFVNANLDIPPDRMEAANWVYQCAIFAFLSKVISSPFNAAIIANERMTAFAYISILDVALKLAIAIFLPFLSGDLLIAYALFILIVTSAVSATFAIYARSHFTETRTTPIRDPELFRSILSFSSWSILSNLSFVLRLQGTNILLNLAFGTIVNAAYGLSLQVATTLRSLATNFIQALNPQIVKSYAAGDMERMHQLVLVGSRVSFFLVLFFTLPAFVELGPLLRLWLVSVPDHTENFVRLFLIQSLIDSFAGVMGTAQGATGRIKAYHLTVSGIGLMTLPISYLFLISGHEPEIVNIVGIGISIIIGMTRVLFIRHSINLSLRSFFREVLVPCVIVTLLAPAFPMLMRLWLPEGWGSVIAVLVLTVLSTFSVIMMVGLKKKERAVFREQVKSKLRKGKS